MQRRFLKGFVSVVLIGVLMAGCATIQENPKTTIGAVGGGTFGGLVAGAAGASPAGIAAGVIGGMLLGGMVGSLLDERDKKMAAEAAYRALETAPTGRPVAWNNPDSGHSGTVTPTKTYQTSGGSYCREYQQTVIIDGKQERGYGTACRQPDGSWKIVN